MLSATRSNRTLCATHSSSGRLKTPRAPIAHLSGYRHDAAASLFRDVSSPLRGYPRRGVPVARTARSGGGSRAAADRHRLRPLAPPHAFTFRGGGCLRIIRWGLAAQVDQIPRERESIAVTGGTARCRPSGVARLAPGRRAARAFPADRPTRPSHSARPRRPTPRETRPGPGPSTSPIEAATDSASGARRVAPQLLEPQPPLPGIKTFPVKRPATEARLVIPAIASAPSPGSSVSNQLMRNLRSPCITWRRRRARDLRADPSGRWADGRLAEPRIRTWLRMGSRPR